MNNNNEMNGIQPDMTGFSQPEQPQQDFAGVFNQSVQPQAPDMTGFGQQPQPGMNGMYGQPMQPDMNGMYGQPMQPDMNGMYGQQVPPNMGGKKPKKPKKPMTKGKLAAIIGGSVAAIAAVVCGVIFLPKIFKSDKEVVLDAMEETFKGYCNESVLEDKIGADDI